MVSTDRLILRLLSLERTFTWDDLETLLGNELKRYARRQIIEKLEDGGLI
ncbi:MAG: hypothetical protein MK005_17645 [Alcanivorax sp.]|nr:hypothetical protein [Alcanivorax sp.]